jgi:hypothetical protein
MLHGALEKQSWRFMRPMQGVEAVLMPTEGATEGGELVIINSKTVALGYIINGQLLPLSREAHYTGDISKVFYFLFFIF